jgi:hypothetical protein
MKFINQKGFPNILIVILPVVIIGGIAGYFLFFQTVNWRTYQNAQYNLSIKYPNDWRFIDFQSVRGMGTLDTFGFIPSTLKNSYCDIEQEASFLVQNYKIYNPFSGYEDYAYNLAKVQSCSIQVRVEKNSEKFTMKDYLEKVYLPLASNKEKMEEKINSLIVTKDNGVEQLWNNYAFIKSLGGYDGSYLQTEIFEDMSQVIINTKGSILFITNHINKPVDRQKDRRLFERMMRTLQVLQ